MIARSSLGIKKNSDRKCNCSIRVQIELKKKIINTGPRKRNEHFLTYRGITHYCLARDIPEEAY